MPPKTCAKMSEKSPADLLLFTHLRIYLTGLPLLFSLLCGVLVNAEEFIDLPEEKMACDF